MDGVKFILLGNGSVGKTSLMLSFTGKPIRVTHIKTIGIDMDKRTFKFQGKDIEVKIWDTAGQERYRNSLPKDLFNRLNGVLLVYDITNRKTFEAVSDWIKLIEENAAENTAIILVGNKVDKDKVEVSEEEGTEFSKSCGMPFILTSAATGLNVEKAFEELLKVAVSKNPRILEEKGAGKGKKLNKTGGKKFLCC